MGIRFQCPTCGHKLNVKSFLAGKRGVCPECSRGLDIPLEDQRGMEPAELPGEESPEAGSEKPPLDAPADSPVPVTRSVSPLPNRAVVTDASPRRGLPPSRPGPTAIAHPIGLSPEAVRPAPAVPTMPAKAPTVPTAAPLARRQVTPTQPVAPTDPAALPIAAPLQAAAVDLIDEAPEAVWYVRPPSGGQYGPARGDVLRKWISEGRVSADSMVWREGWDDWRGGSEVFPYLRAVITPPAPVPVAYAPSTPVAGSNRSYPTRRRTSSTTLAITTVVVLGLLSIVLLVTLVLVIS